MAGRLSILIIPGFFPFPPDDGGKICIYGFIDTLQHEHDIHIFLAINSVKEKTILDSYKKELYKVTFHTIEFLTDSSITFNQKIKYFLQKYLFKKKSAKSRIFDDQSFTIPVTIHPEEYINALTKLFEKTNFDIVQTEYVSVLNIVYIIPHHIKKIYVEIESRHSVLHDYGKSNGINPLYLKYICDNAKEIELSYISKYDAVFTLNERDNIYLSKMLPGIKVYTSPFPVLDKDIITSSIKTKINKLVFVGSEGHYPNYDAVVWFATGILPQLSTNVKLYVTGNRSLNTVKNIKSINENIEFTGFIDKISGLLEGSISVIPIRIGGGGLRTKIIYSMSSGSPVITTTLGAYGLVEEAKSAYALADTESEFVDQINSLFSDEQRTETLINNGRKIVKEFYSQTVVSKLRNEFYSQIMQKE